ncbi:MAG TPA: hypothetical protein VIY52_31330 [Streptosporangiaceae bacterium]
MEDNDTDDVHAETEVRRLLAAAAETIPPATGLLGGVRRRQARRRLRTRAVLSAGSAAVVAAVLLLALPAIRTPSATGPRPASGTVALAALTRAVAKTSAQSYHVSEVTSETFTPQYASRPIVTMQEAGAFDPVRHAGEVTLPLNPEIPAVSEIRYIGNYVYEYIIAADRGISDGQPWDEVRASPPSFPSQNNNHKEIYNGLANLPNDVMGGPVSPQNLLAVLESLGTVRKDGQASGPGWTGIKYSFSATTEDFVTGMANIHRPVLGTVGVDQQGRVRQLVLTTVVQPPWDGVESITNDVTFSDFGARVSVTAPPASQVYDQAAAGWVFGPVPLYVQGAPVANPTTAAPSPVTTPPPSATSPASPAPSATLPVPGVVADCIRAPQQLSIRPAVITLACADDGLGVENMTWTSWTTSAAAGKGTLWEKLCKPDCADGQIGTYPVAVTLSAVKTSSQGRWFSRLTVTWEATRPPNQTPDSFLTPPPGS